MAGFFTRPNLSDIQFRQLTGDTINLSGTTNFAGTLKSKGVEIDGTFTGTTGSVLTYIGGKIRLAPSSSAGSAFDSMRTTTRSGIPAVNVGGSNVNQFLEGYFFPSVPPTLSISGGGTRLFGNNASLTLTWSVRRNTLPITSITVNGNVVPAGFFSVLQPFPNLPHTLSSGTTATITTPNTNQVYTLNSTTASENVNATTTVTFSHKRFFYGENQDVIAFNDANTSANVNLYEVGATSEFSGSKAKSTFAITLSNQYFYYVYPTSFGAAAFTINGLLNTDFSFKDFSFTNSNGFVTSFRMYRTNNLLNGTFNIAVA